MPIQIAALGDPAAHDAPFRFRKGDHVAWKRSDGSADPGLSGVVVDGICEYQPGGGWYRDRYVIELANGRLIGGGHLDFLKLEPEG